MNGTIPSFSGFHESLSEKWISLGMAFLLTFLFFFSLALFIDKKPLPEDAQENLKIRLEKNPLSEPTPVPEKIIADENPIDREIPLDPENFVSDSKVRIPPTQQPPPELTTPSEKPVEQTSKEPVEQTPKEPVEQTPKEPAKKERVPVDKTEAEEIPLPEAPPLPIQDPPLEERKNSTGETSKSDEAPILSRSEINEDVSLVKPTSPSQKEYDNPEDFIPDEIRKTLRGNKPEKSNQDRILFTLDDYNWNFKTYIYAWARDLRKWWRAPSDYISGKYPQGGSVWIRVKITNTGKLVEYKIFHSQVSEEMQLKIVQSLISSFDRNALPESFSGKEITVNWQFIYPPIGRNFDPEK